MIKVIAFDLVGVLVREKDIQLSAEESKLERLFGPNLNDSDYVEQAKSILNHTKDIKSVTEKIMFKLYEGKNFDVIKNIKKHNNIKVIIATNHLSYVKEYLKSTFDMNYIDDIIISAEINKIKPNTDFYEYILKKYKIEPEELLFLDDNIENIVGANKLRINTIKVEKDTNILKEINNFIY